MVRKDYPFSKRTQKQGASLISGLLATIISIPFSMSSSTTYSYTESPNWYENDDGHFFRSKSHYMLGFLSIVFSASCVISYVYFGWWFFFSLIVFGSLEFIMYYPIFDLREGIRKYLEFDKLHYKRQVRKCKRIVLFWFILLTIQLIFCYILQYLPEWMQTDTSFISYGVIFFWGIMKLFLWGTSLFNLKDLHRLISENSSYQLAAETVSQVDFNLLCKIYDGSSSGDFLEIGDGFRLKAIKAESIERSRFVLFSDNYTKAFYLGKYYNNPSQIFTEGTRILIDIANDINDTILIQSTNKK